jgi:hypothetical protein
MALSSQEQFDYIWDRLYFNLGLVHCWEHRCTTGVCWGRFRHCSGKYKAWGASGGKYEARIAIFRILAAVDRFSWISRKVESHWGKSVEESGKLLRKAESRWRMLESRWGKSDFGRGKLDFRRGKSQYFPRDSLVSGNFGDSFSYAICYRVCAWIYFVELNYSQLKKNHHSNTPSTKGDWRRNLQWCD